MRVRGDLVQTCTLAKGTNFSFASLRIQEGIKQERNTDKHGVQDEYKGTNNHVNARRSFG